MVKPASLSRLTGSLSCLALFLGGTVAFAQQARPVEDEKPESEEAIFIPLEYRRPPYQVNVGFRYSTTAHVKFSGLGGIPNQDYYPGDSIEADDTTKTYGRYYYDGAVYPDYTYEYNENGDLEKTEATDGMTNYWNFASSDQIVTLDDGTEAVAMHIYQVLPGDGTAEADSEKSLSWEIEVSRELGSYKRFSWGITFGAGLADINCKTTGTVTSYLRTLTDYYDITGIDTSEADEDDGLSYTGNWEWTPWSYLYEDTDGDGVTELQYDDDGNAIKVYEYDDDGNLVVEWYYDDVQRISTDPIYRTDVTEETPSIVVKGYWQVKGAALSTRVGPYFSYQFTPHLSLKVSGGLLFTLVGLNVWINERAYIPAMDDYLEFSNEEYNLDARVSGLLGYYVSGEIDAFLTDRTGFYVGFSHEDFTRDLSMRYYWCVADFSMETGSVWRAGIVTRF